MEEVLNNDEVKILLNNSREYRVVDERGVWVRFIKDNNLKSIHEAYRLGLYQNAIKARLNFTSCLKLITIIFRDTDSHIYKKLSDMIPDNYSFSFKNMLSKKENNKNVYYFYNVKQKEMDAILYPCISSVVLSIASKLMTDGLMKKERYRNIFNCYYNFKNIESKKKSKQKDSQKKTVKIPRPHIIYVPMGNDRRRR